MLPKLPDIFVPILEKRRLTAVAAAASDSKLQVAPFLRAELHRARYCREEALPADTVVMNGHVRYRVDWGAESKLRRVVYPEDLESNDNAISLLSPLGVALLGLRAGERMPFFVPGEGFRLLTVVEAAPAEPVQPFRGEPRSPKPISKPTSMKVLS